MKSWYYLKRTDTIIQTLKGDCEDSGEENPSKEQNFQWYLLVSPMYKVIDGHKYKFTLISGMVWFGWMEHNWKISDREIWGRGIGIKLSEIHTLKKFVSQVIAQQIGSMVEKVHHKQMNKITYSVDVSESFP